MRTTLDQIAGTVAERSLFPEQGDWYVLHTRSRQEKAVALRLIAMGIGWYLPLLRQVRMHGTRKCVVETPLFPGYVFLRGALEDTYAIDRTQRIAQVIMVADQQKFEDQLRSLDTVQTKGAHLQPCSFVAQGMLVQVRSGPFRGLQGVVDSSGKENRLILQVDVLGQAASLEIDAALLKPISVGREN